MHLRSRTMGEIKNETKSTHVNAWKALENEMLLLKPFDV